MDDKAQRSQVEVTVSWRTILKIALACLLALLAVRLWRLIELLVVALLIAIAFSPMVNWLRRHGWPKWLRLCLCAALLLGSAAGTIGLLVPAASTQGAGLIRKLPEVKDKLLAHLPASIRTSAARSLEHPSLSNPETIAKQMIIAGGAALRALAELGVVLIIAIYFIADGARVYEWLLAFLPEAHRRRLAAAGEEVVSVVGHYMAGQLITSVLCSVFAYAVLMILHVPGALLLALLAGILDVLPLIGFFLFTIPAMGVALTVSPTTALLVGAIYGAYHLLENYFIVPKVYGNRLRLSTLTVLISCLAAGLVAGVVGVIIVLPFVACYPIVERFWLRPYLQRDTVQKHDAIDEERQK